MVENNEELWMKYLLILLLSTCSLLAHSEQDAIEYKIEIYQANEVDLIEAPIEQILANSVLLHAPSMIVNIGESASIEFGDEEAQLKLDVKSDKKGKSYSFEISQRNSASETWSAFTKDAPNIVVGTGLFFTAELLGHIYLFQISADRTKT